MVWGGVGGMGGNMEAYRCFLKGLDQILFVNSVDPTGSTTGTHGE